MGSNTLTLENDWISLDVEPGFGSRITSLTDKLRERQWLCQRPCIGNTSQDGRYGRSEACGWDECFPTVAPCQHPSWNHALRDHGELWGRPWKCQLQSNRLVSCFEGHGFEFRRALELSDKSVISRYEVRNTGTTELPYLWSQHCLLETGTGDYMALDGITDIRFAAGFLASRELESQDFNWPEFNPLNLDLRQIQGSETKLALKLFGKAEPEASAKIQGSDCGIRISWSGTELPFCGLWLDFGGWPPNDPVHQLAIEPTTAAVDDLVGAEKLGQVRFLEAGAIDNWCVRLELIGDVPE